MTNVRLGIVSFAWTKQHIGGLRSHVRDIASQLSELGAQVHVFCVNTDPKDKPFETRSWIEGNIQVQEMNYAYHDLSTFFDFQHVPQANAVLREWAQRLKLEVIDIHHNLFVGMSAIPQLAAITPTAVTLHDYWPLDPRGQLFPPEYLPCSSLTNDQWEAGAQLTWPLVFERSKATCTYFNSNTDPASTSPQDPWVRYSQYSLSASHLLITPSQACAEIYYNHGIKQPIRIIENGINTAALKDQIRNEKSQHPQPGSKIRLSLLGNIAPSKGQLSFCQACLDPRLIDHLELHLYGNVPTTYHGDSKPQSDLVKLCDQHPSTLHLHGSYQRNELPAILERTDLVVMPSLWHEVYGLIAREALCYGLPLIVSNAGGLQELGNRSRVLTLNHLQPSGWAEQISRWLFNGPLIDWVYFRRLRIPPHDNNVRNSRECALQLLDTYKELINNHR